MSECPRFKPLGDAALVVEFCEEISLDVNHLVHALARLVTRDQLTGVKECVPTYCSLLIHYDPLQLNYRQIHDWLADRVGALESFPVALPHYVEIPTVYGGEFGPDLEYVAHHNHLSVEDVIRIHSSGEYLVYMMGFTPGFGYMGGVAETIATPRLEAPRPLVRAGSVGIAGQQTGIYPIDSPGGWRLIGYTPRRFFDVVREPPFLLVPGDVVRFIPVPKFELNHFVIESH